MVASTVNGNLGCLIWDFDGTLAYRKGLWSHCVACAVNRHFPELNVTHENFAAHLRSGFPWHNPDEPHLHLRDAQAWWENLYPVLQNAVCRATGIPQHEAHRIAQEIRQDYLAPPAWTVYEDTIPTLETLRSQGWQHIVLSNHVPELENLMVDLGLRRYFVSVFTSALTGYEKPHIEAFRLVINTLPTHEPIVMVGDSYPADILGAEKVGVRSVLVRQKHPMAQYCLPSLRDLSSILSEPAFWQ